MSTRNKLTAEKSKKLNTKNDKNMAKSFKSVKNKNVKVDRHEANKAIEVEVDKEVKVKLSVAEEILKGFDLNVDYGPLIGISRTDRLKRAEYFNLNLKDEVKDILYDKDLLQRHPELDLNIWHDMEHNTPVATKK